MLGKSFKNATLFFPPVSSDENVLKQTSLPYIILKTTIKNICTFVKNVSEILLSETLVFSWYLQCMHSYVTSVVSFFLISDIFSYTHCKIMIICLNTKMNIVIGILAMLTIGLVIVNIFYMSKYSKSDQYF